MSLVRDFSRLKCPVLRLLEHHRVHSKALSRGRSRLNHLINVGENRAVVAVICVTKQAGVHCALVLCGAEIAVRGVGCLELCS